MKLGALAVLALAAWGVSAAQVRQGWVARFDGPGHYHDRPVGIALDSAGNVYLGGSTYPKGSASNSNYLALKLFRNGALDWWRQYDRTDSDNVRGFGFDPNRGLLIVGTSGLVQYDLQGGFVWAQPSITGAIHVDAAGFLYETGGDKGSLYIRKYDPTGILLWETTYPGQQSLDTAGLAVTADGAGNVYAAGYIDFTHDENTGDALTVKTAPNGALLWARRWIGPAGRNDYGSAIGIDASANVYVALFSGWSVFGLDGDAGVMKYSPAGAFQWATLFDGAGERDSPRGFAVDQAGNSHLSVTSGIDAGYADIVTLKFGSGGGILWNRRHNGPANQFDSAGQLAVDEEGNVYVIGSQFSGPITGSDFVALKYGPTGVPLWTGLYDSPFNSLDDGLLLSLGPDGNVYVAGYSDGGPATRFDIAVVQFVQFETAYPESFLVNPGVLIGGALQDLFEIDGSVVAAKINILAEETGYPIQIGLTGTCPVANPQRLDFTLTASASQEGVGQYVELFDFQAQNWVRVSSRLASLSDSTVTVSAPGPASRFVQAGTRLLRARLGWEEVFAETAAVWQVRVDRARWRVVP